MFRALLPFSHYSQFGASQIWHDGQFQRISCFLICWYLGVSSGRQISKVSKNGMEVVGYQVVEWRRQPVASCRCAVGVYDQVKSQEIRWWWAAAVEGKTKRVVWEKEAERSLTPLNGCEDKSEAIPILCPSSFRVSLPLYTIIVSHPQARRFTKRAMWRSKRVLGKWLNSYPSNRLRTRAIIMTFVKGVSRKRQDKE